jgi:type I restriction enzyme M protein
MDLNSTKLGKQPEERNTIISKVLVHLDKIDFKIEDTEPMFWGMHTNI